MLWWAVAIVGGWLATGALIPVLWKLSGWSAAEEPTSTQGDGEGVLRPSGGSGFDRGYSDYKIGAAQRRIDTISSQHERAG